MSEDRKLQRHKVEAAKDSLSGKDLSNTILNGADLNDCNLSGTNFHGTELVAANFRESNMAGANLSEANLMAADFGGADLTGADLSECAVNIANFTGAQLRGADLRGTSFTCKQLCTALVDKTTRIPGHITLTWTSDTTFDCDSDQEED